MTLIRRILVLAAVSLVGVVLLAPLAARSAAPAPPALSDALLTDPDAPALLADRGALTGRGGLATAPEARGAEEIESGAMPTPASAPMAATIRVVATPRPTPAPAPQRVVSYDGDTVWDRLAQCESGGNWAINTGNGYYGGLQFWKPTWDAYGGGEFAAYPHQATREQQITVAERLRAARGYHPWPACSKKLGLT